MFSKLFPLTAYLIIVGAGACPTELITDCISWTVNGGTCQALHGIVRVRDETGSPVLGADVAFDWTGPTKVSGGPKNKKVTTTATLSSSYTSGLDAQCADDPDPYGGTTAAICWQKTKEDVYSITVTDITLDGCPSAAFNALGQENYSTFSFSPVCT